MSACATSAKIKLTLRWAGLCSAPPFGSQTMLLSSTSQARMDRIQWRLLRVRDYLCGQLLPFFAHNVDTSVDKAIRIVDGTLFVVKTALLQNYPAVLLVETVEILRRYVQAGGRQSDQAVLTLSTVADMA